MNFASKGFSLLLSFLLIWGVGLRAQGSEVDSLLALTGRPEATAAQLTTWYDELSSATRLTDLEASERYARALDSLAGAGGGQYAAGLANLQHAMVALNRGELDAASDKLAMALTFAKRRGEPKLLARVYDNLGVLAYYQGDLPVAAEQFSAGLEAKSSFADSLTLAGSWLRLGLTQTDLGNFAAAEQNLNLAYQTFQRAGDVARSIQSLNNLARLWSDQGQMERAAVAYDTVIAYTRRADNAYLERFANAGRALIYAGNNDLDKALDLYLRNADLANAGDSPLDLADVYLQIGGIHNELGDPEQALVVYDKARNIFEEAGDGYGISSAYRLIGNIYTEAEEYDEALAAQLKALEYGEDVNQMHYGTLLVNIAQLNSFLDRPEQAKAYLLQADSLTSTLDAPRLRSYFHRERSYYLLSQGQPERARQEALTALRLATSAESPDEQLLAYSTLYELEKITDRPAQALAYLEAIDSIKQEQQLAVAQKAIAQERARQNVEDAEAATLAAEDRAGLLRQRNQLYFILALALFALLAVGAYFLWQIRRNKQRIEEQNVELQQLNATKDKFFGIIAHDIRSPIVALDGVGEQMEYYLKKDKPDKLKRLAGRVDTTAKHLNSLLDNLLNWALLQQGVVPYKPQHLPLRRTVEETLSMFQAAADSKSIDLLTDIEPDVAIYADAPGFQTILRNLIANAIKFTEPEGRVTVAAKWDGEQVRLTVEDTGRGMPPEKVADLFGLERNSERGTAGERGTGLGLTLVKELTELNQGSISVRSEPGRGSSFEVLLPAGQLQKAKMSNPVKPF